MSATVDYSEEFIRDNIKSHSAAVLTEQAKNTHMYAACEGEKIIGCGGITGYWGSETESYIMTVFILPEYQKAGIGRQLLETLEKDEFFLRAFRTEVASSLTAVEFYKRMGYTYKNGITMPDEYGCVRMEKFNRNYEHAEQRK